MLPLILALGLLPHHTVLGGWIVSKGTPVISLHFDAWNGKYTLFHDASHGEMYIEAGKYRFRDRRIELRVISARISYPPKIVPNMPRAVPWPSRPVKPEHPSARIFRLRWIDANHFQIADGRVFWRRNVM